MSFRRRIASLAAIILAFGMAVPSFAQGPAPKTLTLTPLRNVSTTSSFVPGQVIVRLHDRSSAAWLRADITPLQAFRAHFPSLVATSVTPLLTGAFRVDVAAQTDIAALTKQLASDPAVAYAQPNYRRSFLRGVNDPLSTFQYPLSKVNAFGAWDITTGSSAVTVAVLDTGVNANHPDLAGRVLPGQDFFRGGTDTSDPVGHGTHIAGIIAASGDNGIGIAGMCWQCKILPVRVGDDRGLSDDAITNGIRWAVDNGARILNLSFGGTSDSPSIHEAIKYAVQKNVLVVAAAGNEADEGNPVEYPAAYDEVIAVGATDDNDQHAFFSQVQSYVDVSAPGWNIPGTGSQFDANGYGSETGTSFAAPYVVGEAALLLSVNPSLDVNALRNLIVSTADDLGDPGPDPKFGAGRINAARAVASVRVPAFDPVADPGQADVMFFNETGHTLRGRLASYWKTNGGLPVFGYPISEMFDEVTPDGTFTVQYFERNRLELHPEKSAPYDVLLGRLSDTLLQRQGRNWFTFPKGQETAGCQFFAETGHTVCEPFLSYWKKNGLKDAALPPFGQSLALFGLPLSEPQPELNSSGENVMTQWFERARFEYHPDKPAQFQVLLGLLGAESAKPASSSTPASGDTPASRCDGIPPAIAGTIRPSACILTGTFVMIDAAGFTAREKVSFYLSSSNGRAAALEPVQADDNGKIALAGGLPLPEGFWALVLHGDKSNHEAVVYIKVVNS